jgi:hypothetical protein
MKASELRIGNLVYEKYPSDLDYEVVDVWYVGRDLSLNYIEPIPLTEEWLLNFGFEKLKEYDSGENVIIQYGKSIIIGDDTHDEKLVISLPFNYCEIGDYQDDSAYILNITIGYVHQLQNLYFTLTNKELEIKDDYYR